MGIQAELLRIRQSGNDAASDLITLTKTHTLLFQIEMKDRLWAIAGMIVSAIVMAIALGGALLCASFALAVTIHTHWSSLGISSSLLIVALFDIIIATVLVVCVYKLSKRIVSLHSDAIQSWIACISNAYHSLI